MNFAVEELLERAERQLAGAHTVDIHVRRGGKDEVFEGDWLKDVIEVLRTCRAFMTGRPT